MSPGESKRGKGIAGEGRLTCEKFDLASQTFTFYSTSHIHRGIFLCDILAERGVSSRGKRAAGSRAYGKPILAGREVARKSCHTMPTMA